MKCSFCGREFTAEAVRKVCRNCALFGGCAQVKCPFCGYESPREPASLTWLKEHMRRKPDDQSPH